jgi:outer membrane protein OmpA-like peptidoglycan-associated protein/uncharacterized protein YegL
MAGCGKTDHKRIIIIKTGYYFVLLALSLACFNDLYSQRLKVYNINTGKFPDITANFALFNENGEFIYDLQKEEVSVTEDSLEREIIEFYNPSRHLLRSSILLMLDISKSMTGERLQILKEAATYFIDSLPLDITEVAIGTFNDNVYLNCDFTQKTDRLRQTIQMIEADGETDYNNAFLHNYSGAIDIARHGFYKKKIIIFLTDGLAGAQMADIISRANSDNISVYCITVKLRMPYVLKKIAEETGGDWFEEINTLEMTNEAYNQIFEHAQSSTFGYIRWRSEYSCNSSVKVHLNFRGTSVNLCYEIPGEKRGQLEAGSSSLYFSDVVPGVQKELTVAFDAKNIPVTITGIRNMNPGFFSYEYKNFPVIIPENRSVKIKFYYMPCDSGIRTDQFQLFTKECGDFSINAFGGSENKIKLVHPRGGEVFVPGMDTSICWEGIEKSTSVLLSVKNGSTNQPWSPIAKSTVFHYSWTVPGDTGTKIRVKASTLTELNKKSELFIRTRINDYDTPLFSVNYSADGTEIYTCDSSGLIKIWKESNGQLMKTLDRRSLGYVVSSPVYDRIISLSESGIGIFTNRAGMHIGHVGSPGKKLYTSVISYNGKEYYSNATQEFYNVTPVRWKTGKNTGIWDPLQKIYLSLPADRKYEDAAFSTSRLYAITLLKDNLILWNTNQPEKIKKFRIASNFSSAIFNPAKNMLSINNQYGLTIFDIDKNKNQLRIAGEKYVQFSPKGGYIVTSTDNHFNIRRIADTRQVAKIDHPQFINFTADDNHILYSRNDTVFILDLPENEISFMKYFPNLVNAIFNHSENKILLYSSNFIDIIDRSENQSLFTATFRENDFRSFVFSPSNDNILSITNDNEAVVWRPTIKTAADSSGCFTILSPKPAIKDTVFFGEQEKDKPMEMIVSDYIKNTFKFPIRINNIQINGDKNHEFGIVSELPPYSIDPFSARGIELRFNPIKEGQRVACMIVYTPTDSFRTILKGFGMEPEYEIPLKMIDFGTVEIFREKDTLVTIFKNPAKDTIYITGIENSGPDTEQFRLLTSQLTHAVPPQGELKLDLRFMPRHRGHTNGSLKLIRNDRKERINVSLFGEGKAPVSIFVHGKSLNNIDGTPLEADIKCTDLLTQRNIVDTITGKDGIFGFYLRPDRIYALIGEKAGYISSSENIDLDKPVPADTIYRDIFLTGIKDNAIFKLNNIFFEFGKADLLETSYSDLNRILSLLVSKDNLRIEIHGHTDDIGSNESNMDLAGRRAISVKKYLIDKGIDESRLETFSFGESSPVATNETDEGRQLNRRVEIKIISDER